MATNPEPISSNRPQTEISEENVSKTSIANANTKVENDGARMMHLRDALRKTIKKCVDSARFSTFDKQYGKHMPSRNPPALKSLLHQFKEQLEKSIKEELELMIEEENLVPLFNELDKLADGPRSETDQLAWRPSGEPERDSGSHVMTAKLKERERLEAVLRETEQEGEGLLEVIKGHRQQLTKTQARIKEHLDAFSQAFGACDQVPVRDLEKVLDQLSSVANPP